MSSSLRFLCYLIPAVGLLWLVQDSLEGWGYAAVVVAILAIYVAGILEGLHLGREVQERRK